MRTEFICLRIRTSGGSCEHGNNISDSIKGGISWPAELPSVSQEELCFLELVYLHVPRAIYKQVYGLVDALPTIVTTQIRERLCYPTYISVVERGALQKLVYS